MAHFRNISFVDMCKATMALMLALISIFSSGFPNSIEIYERMNVYNSTMNYSVSCNQIKSIIYMYVE